MPFDFKNKSINLKFYDMLMDLFLFFVLYKLVVVWLMVYLTLCFVPLCGLVLCHFEIYKFQRVMILTVRKSIIFI